MPRIEDVIAGKLLTLAEHLQEVAKRADTRARDCRIEADALHDLAIFVKDGALSEDQIIDILDICTPAKFIGLSAEPGIEKIKRILKGHAHKWGQDCEH